MRASLRLAVWPSGGVPGLGAIETAVIADLQPPLNLGKVATPWRRPVKDAEHNWPPRRSGRAT